MTGARFIVQVMVGWHDDLRVEYDAKFGFYLESVSLSDSGQYYCIGDFDETSELIPHYHVIVICKLDQSHLKII